ncbi:MAG: hypothetical protein K8R87_09800, partial [Verrucomicrobia bacterium]|nr:hypothetical protein [Verrucomicrobiota bacterium]
IGVTQPKEHTAPISGLGGTSASNPITTSVTPAGAATARVPTSPVGMVGGGASKSTAPIQLPSAPLPAAATRAPTTQVHLPPAPSVPSAPRAPGAPSGPPRPPGVPPPSLSPTVPLAKIPGGAIRPPGSVGPKPPGAKVEAGASTVPLTKGPSAPKPLSLGVAPGAKPGPTQALPQATVQLGKSTVPLAKQGTPLSAPVKQRTAQEEYVDEKDPEAGLAPLAVVCMILSIALMGVNLLGTDKAFFDEKGDSAFMVPAPNDPAWEVKQSDGSHKSTFSTKLSEITKKLD